MPRVCVHLDEATDWEYALYFTGSRLEYALVCLTCSEHPAGVEANLREVSAERFAQIVDGGSWNMDEHAIIGRPQVMERPSGLTFRHEDIVLTEPLPAPVADVRPIPASDHGEFLVLLDDGDLSRIDPRSGRVRRLINALDMGVALCPKRRLRVSPGGEMAAVVETRGTESGGQYGIVLDLEAGRTTMRLDRGGYHSWATDFPAAFFQVDGRLRLVHGTDWNRLDISDPRTGELLTGRSPSRYHKGDERPEHYLDYFHGGLAVSPGGEWIVDNGFVWGAAGIVTAWSLRRWMEDNPWESEDGPSKRRLSYRGYFWDGPLCWIDERTVAFWGYGNDDENLIPAALLFDVESGRRIRWFAGPVGSFTFDRYLFSCSTEAGTSVWDVATGERLLHDASFCPTAYHPGAGHFVTARADGVFRLSRLVAS